MAPLDGEAFPDTAFLILEKVVNNYGKIQAETVRCRVWQDGAEVLERRFSSPRRVDVDLLAEAIESTGDDRIERETIRMAGMMVMPLSDGGEPL